MGSPRLALVGTFVVGGLLLFAVGLFMIGDRRLLFTERFEVEADFGNVHRHRHRHRGPPGRLRRRGGAGGRESP